MLYLEANNLLKRFLLITLLVCLVITIGLTVKNKFLSALDSQFLASEPEISQAENQTVVLGAETKIDEPEFESKLYNLINGYRKENHLSTLKVAKQLQLSAKNKLADMIKNKYWQHTDEQQIGPWYFFTQAEYQFALAGENLAFSATSPWQVFTDWQQSPAHNEQLLTPDYKDFGLAIDCQTYQSYYQTGCLVVLHLGKLK